MADKKISQLTALSAANLAPSTDVLAIVDTSATETKKIVAQDLVNGVLNVASAVGIGTSSPAAKLDVAGNVLATAWIGRANGSAPTGDASVFRAADNTLAFATGSTERMRLDSSGNLGLGVTPSAWTGSGGKNIEIGATGNAIFGSGSLTTYTYNANFDSSWKYSRSDFASRYEQQTGTHRWFTAPSGTAGNAISFTQALTLDANVNLLLNGTAAPASGVGTFAIFNGTAPTGSVTNGCVLYTEDVSSSSELKVRDEAGNVTTLSPHNFSLISEGPSEDMAWSYYSERDGKRINIDMLKAIRVLEKLSGEKLVHES